MVAVKPLLNSSNPQIQHVAGTVAEAHGKMCTLQYIALLSKEGIKLHNLNDHLEHAPRRGRSHVHTRIQSLLQ